MPPSGDPAASGGGEVHAYERTPIDALYRWFAGEAEVTSPVWGRFCRWVADTPSLHERLDGLPGRKRQPNLFLGAIRYLGGPTEPGEAFLAWLDGRWPDVHAVILARATQTNEPGRCAVLAPLLASLPGPVALLEAGASAGLCLLPDRYAYRWTGQASGRFAGREAAPDAPELVCDVSGAPPASPDQLVVATRAGLDPNPLRADDPDDARWLRALVWPGEEAREERLSAALRVAATDPPRIVTGSLPGDLERLLALAPPGATPVVMHSATLAYLPRSGRDAVEAALRASGARWVSFEGPTVVSSLRGALAADLRGSDRPHFVLALDGEPVARCGAHGGWVQWL